MQGLVYRCSLSYVYLKCKGRGQCGQPWLPPRLDKIKGWGWGWGWMKVPAGVVDPSASGPRLLRPQEPSGTRTAAMPTLCQSDGHLGTQRKRREEEPGGLSPASLPVALFPPSLSMGQQKTTIPLLQASLPLPPPEDPQGGPRAG